MKKFIYIDDLTGREKEALSYEVADFVATSIPNSPVLTGPDGKLSPSLIPTSVAGKSASLVIERTAGEDITAGDLVHASVAVPGEVLLADADDTAAQATVLGMATQTRAAGQLVEVLVAGVYLDPAFSVFPVNAQLFLDLAGAVTDDRPVSPSRKYLSNIGKSLGGGEILVNPATPVQLGA